jgi:geranylgeranyl reductase family protein
VLAHDLGAAGRRVLLLEKQRLPRHKTCGGGLTYKVLQVLPFDVSPVIERTVGAMQLSWRLSRPALLEHARPLAYMVCRDRFDAYLVEQARRTGCVDVVDGAAVAAVAISADGVQVGTHGQAFEAAVLVGADGANGTVARSLSLLPSRQLLPAVEFEVACDAGTLHAWQNRMGIDVGTMPGSYGWVFPKQDHLNVGVGCFSPDAADPRRLNRYAADHLRAMAGAAPHVRRQTGYVLPLRHAGEPVQRGRALLVGDAAGLVEGFSGEGIYWAIRSARIAAREIVGQPEANAAGAAYQRAIDAELMPELLEARRLSALYVSWPRAFYSAPKRLPAAWSVICRVLRGEKSFVDVGRKLGPLMRIAGLLAGQRRRMQRLELRTHECGRRQRQRA